METIGYTFNYNGYRIIIDGYEVILVEKSEYIEYFVGDYGAVGDGITNDFEAIQNAVDECYKNGGGVVTFDGSKTYLLKRPENWSTSIEYNTSCAINLKPKVNIEGNGCKIQWYHTNGVFNTDGRRRKADTVSYLTRNIEKETNEIYVDNIDNYNIGDMIIIFGEDNESEDKFETKDWMFNKIANIDRTSNKITLFDKINFDVNLDSCNQLGSVSNGEYNGAIMNIEVYENTFIRNITISNNGNGTGSSIHLNFAKNVMLDNIVGENLTNAITTIQFSENITLNNYRINNFVASNKSTGIISIYEGKNINVNNSSFDKFFGAVLNLESYCSKIALNNCTINLNQEKLKDLNSDTNSYSIISASVKNEASINGSIINCLYDDMKIIFLATYLENQLKYNDLTLITQNKLNLMNINLNNVTGKLSLVCNNEKRILDFNNLKEYNFELSREDGGLYQKYKFSNKMGLPVKIICNSENCNADDVQLFYGENIYPYIDLTSFINKEYKVSELYGKYTSTQPFLSDIPWLSVNFSNDSNSNSKINCKIIFAEEQ